jgi:hypothetical protein
MRIPPSVFVMSALTCVPFGLGIRDTLHRKDAERERVAAELAEEQAQQAQTEAAAKEEADRAAKEAEVAAAQRKTREALVPSIFGAKPGTPGELFGDIKLGAPQTDASSDALEAVREKTQLGLAVSTLGDNVGGVSVSLPSASDCPLRSHVPPSWGQPIALELNTSVWLDGTNRAVLVDGDEACMIEFDQAVPVSQVFSRSGKAMISMAQLGTSATAFAAKLPHVDRDDDDQVMRWDGPGVGAGRNYAHFSAGTRNDKLYELNVSMTMSNDDFSKLHDLMIKQLGKPTEDLGSATSWETKTHVVTLSSGGASVTLDVSLPDASDAQ